MLSDPSFASPFFPPAAWALFRSPAGCEGRHAEENDEVDGEHCRRSDEGPAVPEVQSSKNAHDERQHELAGGHEGLDENDRKPGRVGKELHELRVGAGVEKAVGAAREEAENVGNREVAREEMPDEEGHVDGDAPEHEGLSAPAVRERSRDVEKREAAEAER